MNCLECGEEFLPFRPNQKFCCPQCCKRYYGRVLNPVAAKVDAQPTPRVKRLKVDTPPTAMETPTLRKEIVTLVKVAVKDSTRAVKKKPATSDKTLADWIREADDCHLDYGTYRSLISAGKTFDELKKTFGRQVPPAHSKGASRNHFTGGNII